MDHPTDRYWHISRVMNHILTKIWVWLYGYPYQFYQYIYCQSENIGANVIVHELYCLFFRNVCNKEATKKPSYINVKRFWMWCPLFTIVLIENWGRKALAHCYDKILSKNKTIPTEQSSWSRKKSLKNDNFDLSILKAIKPR